MAAEAGASLSGMEFTGKYTLAPHDTSLNKGLPFRWATFYDADGAPLRDAAGEPVANGIGAGREGRGAGADRRAGLCPARPGRAERCRRWLRQGQPNCFLPYDRARHRPVPRPLPRHAARRGHGARHRRHPHHQLGMHDRGPRALRRRRRRHPRERRGRDLRRRRRSTRPGRCRAAGGPARAPPAHARRRGAPGAFRAVSRRSAPPACARPSARAPSTRARWSAAVRDEVIPLDKNYFRDGAQLAASRERLESALARGRRRISPARAPAGSAPARSPRSPPPPAGRSPPRSPAPRAAACTGAPTCPGATTRSALSLLVSGLDEVTSAPADPAGRTRGACVMIEVVSEERCIRCDICERVCPAYVFDRDAEGAADHRAPGRLPDLLPLRDLLPDRRPLRVADRRRPDRRSTRRRSIERELFGSYARALGWSRGRAGGTENDPTRHIRVAQV